MWALLDSASKENTNEPLLAQPRLRADLGNPPIDSAPLHRAHAPQARAGAAGAIRLILEPRTFLLGPYTVILREEYRQWLYSVYLNAVRIGKCVSVPDLDACESLVRHRQEMALYAIQYALPPVRSSIRPSRKPIPIKRRVGRPTSTKTTQDIARALAGD